MEIKDFIRMIRRWAWVLAFGLVVGGLSAFLVSLFQTPIYRAATRIFVGLLFALGIAFLIEYLDDTIRSPEDVARILKLAVIGNIGGFINRREDELADVHVLNNPGSPFSEAFRSLYKNLDFNNIDRKLKTILITSSGTAEGKTMIAVSLATIIAQGGKRVLLVDADMRRPRIHKIFGLANQIGLSTLFRGNIAVRLVMQSIVGLENVFIITSGELPSNPSELLASTRMDQILREAGQYVDVIVVDSPPSCVADYQVLAAKLDGVLIVIQPGQTRTDAALGMVEQLGRVAASILGVVMNKIPRNSKFYGGYYPQPQAGNPPRLRENNQNVKFLPQVEIQFVGYFDPQQYQSPKNFDNVFQSRDQLEVNLPTEDVAATLNISTKPGNGSESLSLPEGLTFVIQNPHLEY